MLRKRVAELGGITQAELEQRFELAAPRRAAEAPPRTLRRGSDVHAKLLERVLAEPALLDELAPVDLAAMDAASAEARALADLIEQRRTLSGALSVPGAMELLRQGGHEAVLRSLLPAIQDLQRLGLDELRLEVRGLVQALALRAENAEVKRALDGVQSPRDLTDEARGLVARALARGKVVQND
jgi:hypothetical protein